ncbi:hypothetical protein KY325_00540 [Candidatus Woesearchaeota archaeon]|nr:hypothetical protein [Candidatus Woesearchaeota archaeon]
MLVVSIVSAPQTQNPGAIGDDDVGLGQQEGTEKKIGADDVGGGKEEGLPKEIGVETGGNSQDKAKAGEVVSQPGKENSVPGTPPSGEGPVPEFSTIGLFAAAAAGALGYMYMRKRRK